MTTVTRNFDLRSLPGDPGAETALLVNPPVYDARYWAEWSQPYGLLCIDALLRRHGHKRVLLYDFMETPPNGKRLVPRHRINPAECGLRVSELTEAAWRSAAFGPRNAHNVAVSRFAATRPGKTRKGWPIPSRSPLRGQRTAAPDLFVPFAFLSCVSWSRRFARPVLSLWRPGLAHKLPLRS